MQGIGSQSIALGALGNGRQRAPTHKINNDRNDQHAIGQPCGVDMSGIGCDQAMDGFIENASGQHHEQAGLGQGGNGFDFAMAVMVLIISRFVCGAHRIISDNGGARVEQAMACFRQKCERAGQQAGDQFAQRQKSACKNRGQRSGAFQALIFGCCMGAAHGLLDSGPGCVNQPAFPSRLRSF